MFCFSLNFPQPNVCVAKYCRERILTEETSLFILNLCKGFYEIYYYFFPKQNNNNKKINRNILLHIFLCLERDR